MSHIAVSAVIPVNNDIYVLHRTIPLTIEILEEMTPYFEIIIAEDASTDGSREIARKWSDLDSRVRHLHCDERRKS